MQNHNCCYNRCYREPYIFEIPFQTKKTCDEQMNVQKTSYELQIKELRKKLDDKNEQLIFTSETCTKNRELQDKEYEKQIDELKSEIKKLKEENEILTAKSSDFEIQFNDFNDRKLAYCQNTENNYRPSLGSKVSMKSEESPAIKATAKRLSPQ